FWVRENSNVQRERYLFAGSYLDETKQLDEMGSRWYEPHEGTFYAADPQLTEDLDSAVDEPQLLGAFNYAFDNPATLIDEGETEPASAQANNAAQTWHKASTEHLWVKASPT